MTTATNSPQQIDLLTAKMKGDKDLAKMLTASLQQADTIAQKELHPALYKVLTWPTDIDEYITYLEQSARWIPQQSKDDAWLAPGTDEHQEAYDRLCHFYWLIDQKVEPNDTIVENIPWFSDWLVGYANLWGSFLNTTESFNDEILQSFIDYSPKYEVENSMVDGRPNSPSGWLTFNQFFARELNPGLRPITSPTDNSIVTSPAESV